MLHLLQPFFRKILQSWKFNALYHFGNSNSKNCLCNKKIQEDVAFAAFEGTHAILKIQNKLVIYVPNPCDISHLCSQENTYELGWSQMGLLILRPSFVNTTHFFPLAHFAFEVSNYSGEKWRKYESKSLDTWKKVSKKLSNGEKWAQLRNQGHKSK
jgi:hypothetical protein